MLKYAQRRARPLINTQEPVANVFPPCPRKEGEYELRDIKKYLESSGLSEWRPCLNLSAQVTRAQNSHTRAFPIRRLPTTFAFTPQAHHLM